MEGDAGMVTPGAATYIIELKNAGTTDLTLSIDKGWAFTVFAVPSKDRKLSPWLFPKFCTASCSAEPKDLCPICEVEEENVIKRKKAEIAGIKEVVVPPGKSHTLPWNGKLYVYEKTSTTVGRRKRSCDCYQEIDAPPGTYTVQGLGRRPPAKVGKAPIISKPTAEVVLPMKEMPGKITLVFE